MFADSEEVVSTLEDTLFDAVVICRYASRLALVHHHDHNAGMNAGLTLK